MTNFEGFGLNETLIRAIEKKKYKTPTPIQEQAIPHIMRGKDILGIAQTGTGKTAAFALPILHNLLAQRIEPPKRGTRVLILAPTRELVGQILDNFKEYAQGTSLKIFALTGGVAHKPQIDKLIKGLDVLIATPGRLMDHIDDNNFRPKEVETLVLDEVDQMLDMGFIGSVKRLAKKISDNRQNLFFSATMPKEIQSLADELLKNPVRVEVAPAASAQELVDQNILMIEASKKRSLLVDLFEGEHLSKVMVFTRTKFGADKVARHMSAFGIKNVIIHGGKAQSQRSKSFELFKAGKVRAMVATDVAARGIDIKEITHVINFDMPTTPEAYVHRIGRTARAGLSGHAYSLCTNTEMHLLQTIERTTRQTINKIDRRNDASLIADKHVVLPEIKHEEKEDRPQRKGKFGDKKRFEGRSDRSNRSERPEREERNFGDKKPRKTFIDSHADNEAWGFVENALNGKVKEDTIISGEFKRKPRAEKSFEGRSERPARSFDDRPKRDFGDRPKRDFGDKPNRSFEGRSERPARSFDDKPKRDFSDRPKRDFGDKPNRSFEGRSERPARSFDDRPKRDFSDRPKRDFGDKPNRSFEGRSERPARSFDDRPKRDFGDKPNRSFEGRSERPARSFDDRPKRDFGDRPKRDFGDKPNRSFEGRSERPARSFDDRPKRDFKPRSEGNRSEGRSEGRSDKPRSFGAKPNFGDKARSFGSKPNFGAKPSGDRNRSARPTNGGNDRPKRRTFA